MGFRDRRERVFTYRICGLNRIIQFQKLHAYLSIVIRAVNRPKNIYNGYYYYVYLTAFGAIWVLEKSRISFFMHVEKLNRTDFDESVRGF